MKKIKITKEQYDRLLAESADIRGGINRVNKTFKSNFSNSGIKNLKEEPFNISKPIQGIGNSTMKNVKPVPMPEQITEDILSPEAQQAIQNFIEGIWLNQSQRGLDKFFVDNGIKWGDIITYLTSMGIIASLGAGVYKVTNFFKRKFSGDKELDNKQKKADIEKMARMVTKDPESPWQRKVRLQQKPESGWEATPKSFNPKGRKSVSSGIGMEETSNYPAGTENDPNSPWNQDSSDVEYSDAPKVFKPLAMNYEIAILNGPDGLYVFYYDDINREDLPNNQYELNSDDLADYVNQNINKIQRGDGISGWNSNATLIKIDDELKNELITLYGKNKEIVGTLRGLDEMTSASSSGSFTGKFGGQSNIQPNNSPSELINSDEINEMDTTGGAGNQVSSTTGQYTQPAIWANGKKNWKAAKKTQYPNGEMVDFDSCTKLNNNKSAQNGKCSTGASDNVVKTHRTKQSVISKTIYEEVAKKTGKTIEEVEKIIKLNKSKSNSLR